LTTATSEETIPEPLEFVSFGDIVAQQASSETDVQIATPRGSGGAIGLLLQSQWLLALGARIGAWLAAIKGAPFRLGSFVIAARHADVTEMLARDLDFLIAPINAARIEAVNGPFVLGMDRGATLSDERNALYSAFRQVDRSQLRAQIATQAEEAIARAPSGSLDVIGDYARPIAARTASDVFGIGPGDDRLFMDVARAIFAHTFLNITGDTTVEARALRAAALMRDWFREEIARRRSSGNLGVDMMGALLRDALLDDEGVRRTLGGMLVGAIDTTATAVAKIVTLLGQDSRLRERMNGDRDDPTRMTNWCLEALRRWPHNPVVLRKSAAETQLGKTRVEAGATVVAWTQAAMLDRDAFPEPGLLDPDRPRGAYLHFGGGLHPCAGRAINEFQIPILVGRLLARGIENVGRIDWAGPFPDRLLVTFSGR